MTKKSLCKYIFQSVKKPAIILAIFILTIEAYKKAYTLSALKIFLPLKYILCIYCLVLFKKNQAKI